MLKLVVILLVGSLISQQAADALGTYPNSKKGNQLKIEDDNYVEFEIQHKSAETSHESSERAEADAVNVKQDEADDFESLTFYGTSEEKYKALQSKEYELVKMLRAFLENNQQDENAAMEDREQEYHEEENAPNGRESKEDDKQDTEKSLNKETEVYEMLSSPEIFDKWYKVYLTSDSGLDSQHPIEKKKGYANGEGNYGESGLLQGVVVSSGAEDTTLLIPVSETTTIAPLSRYQSLKKEVDELSEAVTGAGVNKIALDATYVALFQKYDTDYIMLLIEKVIDNLYPFENVMRLQQKLELIESHSRPIFINCLVYLFKKFHWNDDFNEEYVLRIAHQLRRSGLHFLSDQKLRNRIEHTIELLPSSVRNLLFEPYFCLVNAEANQYMYTAATDFDIDAYRRYVFVWSESNYTDHQGTWKLNQVHNGLEYEVELTSNAFEFALHEDSAHLISAWRTREQPTPTLWTIELKGNTLVFRRDNRVMCMSDQRHDELRRFVYTYVDGWGQRAYSPACQWKVQKCDNANWREGY